MTGGIRSVHEIETVLDRRLTAVRKETRLFTLFVVLFTPLAVVLSVGVLVSVGQWVGLPVNAWAARHPAGVTLAPTIALTLLLSGPFVRCLLGRIESAAARRRCKQAFLVYLAILGATFGTPLPTSSPVAFWTGYVLAALAALALLGRAYRPKREYYLGWQARGGLVFDNPFTFRDDLDRHDFALGFAVAIPAAVLHAYSEVFTDSWLWKGLAAGELRTAARVVHRLLHGNREEAHELLATRPRKEAERVVRALLRMRWVAAEEGILRLSVEGAEGVGMDPMLVA